MNPLDAINLALTIYKDTAYKSLCDTILSAAQNLCSAEAESRRTKTTELILSRARLENSLIQLEQSYQKLKANVGSVAAIEELITKTKHEIACISAEKKALKRR